MTNRDAFLAMIGVSEGTSTSPATKNAGFDVIVTGIDGVPEVFTDYSTHPFARGRPPKLINAHGLRSTASGFAQFMLHDYAHYTLLLNLPDFGPDSQRKWALQLIRETGALPMIDAGDIAGAIGKVAHLWASLPGAGYGQPERALAKLLSIYAAARAQSPPVTPTA